MDGKRMMLLREDGIMQFIGFSPTQPPEVLADAEGHAINLVAVKPRYYLYKPMAESPGLKRFNEHQQ